MIEKFKLIFTNNETTKINNYNFIFLRNTPFYNIKNDILINSFDN